MGAVNIGRGQHGVNSGHMGLYKVDDTFWEFTFTWWIHCYVHKTCRVQGRVCHYDVISLGEGSYWTILT